MAMLGLILLLETNKAYSAYETTDVCKECFDYFKGLKIDPKDSQCITICQEKLKKKDECKICKNESYKQSGSSLCYGYCNDLVSSKGSVEATKGEFPGDSENEEARNVLIHESN